MGHSTSHVCNETCREEGLQGESHPWKAGLLETLSSPPQPILSMASLTALAPPAALAGSCVLVAVVMGGS